MIEALDISVSNNGLKNKVRSFLFTAKEIHKFADIRSEVGSSLISDECS